LIEFEVINEFCGSADFPSKFVTRYAVGFYRYLVIDNRGVKQAVSMIF
jgi:hypothetical protein